MPGAPEDARSTTRASMASTEAYARGDYGRGDADADVNRAPSPMGTMTTSKDEVDAAPPMGCCAKWRKRWRNIARNGARRGVRPGGGGVNAVVRLNVTMYGGQGCFGPSRMLGRVGQDDAAARARSRRNVSGRVSRRVRRAARRDRERTFPRGLLSRVRHAVSQYRVLLLRQPAHRRLFASFLLQKRG